MNRTYPRYAIAAVGAVLLRDSKILLVKRGFPPGLGKWSIPGGVIEAGEKLVEAAKRELKEETGLEADPLGVLWVLNNVVYDKEMRVLYHYTIIDILFDPATIKGNLRPGGDVLDVAWFKLSDLYSMENVSSTTKWLVKRIERYGLTTLPVEEVDHVSVQV